MEITGSPDVFPGSIKTPLPHTHNRILPTSLTICWTFFFKIFYISFWCLFLSIPNIILTPVLPSYLELGLGFGQFLIDLLFSEVPPKPTLVRHSLFLMSLITL